MDFNAIVDESIETLSKLKDLGKEFEEAAKLLVGSLKSGGKALICGNGGSAADAMHLATELVGRFETERPHLPAICLNSSGPDLTALTNDFPYKEVFARQLRAFAKPGDLVIALSTSGRSENIEAALRESLELSVSSLALLGRDGGSCAGLASVEMIVASNSTARIQEAHQVIIHALCREVDMAFGRNEGR